MIAEVTLTFDQARACVLQQVRSRRKNFAVERMKTLDAAGRILAEPIAADRDYPPFPRSARDGFAVRAADLPGELRVIGEVRAGSVFSGAVSAGEAVEIMTGAPLPDGADAVVMVEHTSRNGDTVRIDRTQNAGDNFNLRGVEARHMAKLLEPGCRLGFSEIALLATVGRERLTVYTKPRVAVLPTGDEIVDVSETPAAFQIRNSNAWSMATQVARAGGDPHILPIARDNYESTHALVKKGLTHDLLLLSGGVSAGKYDIVERVLADFGAEFYFTRVLIQPGQPLVFGRAQNTFFFGLPGNPASTMVTLEIFARAAIELLSGASHAPLPLLQTSLSRDFQQKPGLTRFLPACVADDGASVEPLSWQGSGDVGALARANAFLVTEPDRETWKAGEMIRVLIK
ncbi:MAG: gephyrin-like molybdotransferase Glp [Acidobacteriota bacterium]